MWGVGLSQFFIAGAAPTAEYYLPGPCTYTHYFRPLQSNLFNAHGRHNDCEQRLDDDQHSEEAETASQSSVHTHLPPCHGGYFCSSFLHIRRGFLVSPGCSFRAQTTLLRWDNDRSMGGCYHFMGGIEHLDGSGWRACVRESCKI